MKKIKKQICYQILVSRLNKQVLLNKINEFDQLNVLIYASDYKAYKTKELEMLVGLLLKKNISQIYFLWKNAALLWNMFDQVAVWKYMILKDEKYLHIYTTSKEDEKLYDGDITAFLLTKTNEQHMSLIICDNKGLVWAFTKFQNFQHRLLFLK